MDLLKNIAWAFNGTSYDHPDDFNKAVAQYQHDIYHDDTRWQPDTVVLESPEVQIVYEYYITPNDIRFEDEAFLDEDEADVQINDPEEENEQREVAATFRAANGKSFTASDILYQLHQRSGIASWVIIFSLRVFLPARPRNANTRHYFTCTVVVKQMPFPQIIAEWKHASAAECAILFSRRR